MNSVGYERMKIALENYLKMGENAFDEDVIANMEDIIANMNFQKQNGYSMYKIYMINIDFFFL